MNTGAILVLTVVALTVTGCNRTEKDWIAAKQANTTDAYREFLTKHPQGTHVEDARSGIEALDWKDAEARGTNDAYEGYLKAHPAGGVHVEDARNGIEALDWKDAQTKGTNDAYEGYLKAHPAGAHAKDARNGIYKRLEGVDCVIEATYTKEDSYGNLVSARGLTLTCGGRPVELVDGTVTNNWLKTTALGNIMVRHSGIFVTEEQNAAIKNAVNR